LKNIDSRTANFKIHDSKLVFNLFEASDNNIYQYGITSSKIPF